jgi:hypothetical protein
MFNIIKYNGGKKYTRTKGKRSRSNKILFPFFILCSLHKIQARVQHFDKKLEMIKNGK